MNEDPDNAHPLRIVRLLEPGELGYALDMVVCTLMGIYDRADSAVAMATPEASPKIRTYARPTRISRHVVLVVPVEHVEHIRATVNVAQNTDHDIQAAIAESHKRGLRRGRDLLRQLAAGEITTETFHGEGR